LGRLGHCWITHLYADSDNEDQIISMKIIHVLTVTTKISDNEEKEEWPASSVRVGQMVSSLVLEFHH